MGGYEPQREHLVMPARFRAVRHLADLQCWIRTGEGSRTRGHVHDLSESGIFLELDSPPPVDTEVTILMRGMVDGAPFLRVQGKVRRVNEQGAGISFESIGAGTETALQYLLTLISEHEGGEQAAS